MPILFIILIVAIIIHAIIIYTAVIDTIVIDIILASPLFSLLSHQYYITEYIINT